MGWYMQKHDLYIGSILEELNLRFAPGLGSDELFGGVEEMVALQKEFEIFKEGRSFRASAALMNVCARNNETKNKWLAYLGSLAKHPSNLDGLTGDAAIVRALVRNLSSASPLPVYFTSHDLQENEQVQVIETARPIHYLEQDYLVISFPMQSVQAARTYVREKVIARAMSRAQADSGARRQEELASR